MPRLLACLILTTLHPPVPGWDQDAQPLASFEDVRELQRRLKEKGVSLISEADGGTTGPASFTLLDPDGNSILFDQHV